MNSYKYIVSINDQPIRYKTAREAIVALTGGIDMDLALDLYRGKSVVIDNAYAYLDLYA